MDTGCIYMFPSITGRFFGNGTVQLEQLHIDTSHEGTPMTEIAFPVVIPIIPIPRSSWS